MKRSFIAVLFIAVFGLMVGCGELETQSTTPTSSSSVKKASVEVVTQANGKTLEQNNIATRYEMENKPGTIQHLYVLSAYSGQVILYSTVKGKVTSSGKRLTPLTVSCTDGQYVGGEHQGFSVDFDGHVRSTGEVLQDDGTYGSSIDYLYWWDVQGVYHQLYVTGGMILQLASQPMNFRRVTMQIEQQPK